MEVDSQGTPVSGHVRLGGVGGIAFKKIVIMYNAGAKRFFFQIIPMHGVTLNFYLQIFI